MEISGQTSESSSTGDVDEIIDKSEEPKIEPIVRKIRPPLDFGFRIGYNFEDDDPDTVKAAIIAEKKTILWVQWSGELRTSNWGFNVDVDGDGNVFFSGKASGAAPHNITLIITGTWRDSKINLKSVYSDNTLLKYEGFYKREGEKVKFELERTIVQIGHKTTTNFNWKKGKIGRCGGEFLSTSWLKNDNPLPSIPGEPTKCLSLGEEYDVLINLKELKCPKKLNLSSDFSFATYVNTNIPDQFQIIIADWPLKDKQKKIKFFFALTPIAGSYQFVVVFQLLKENIIHMKAGNIKVSQWSHLAFTWNTDKKEAILYIDGFAIRKLIVKEEIICDEKSGPQKLELGYLHDDEGEPSFSGRIRQLTIYNECVNAFYPQDLYKRQFVRRATAKFNRVEEDLPDKKDWHENIYLPYEVGDQFNITADDYEHWYDAFRCSDSIKCLIQKNMFDVEIPNIFDEKLDSLLQENTR